MIKDFDNLDFIGGGEESFGYMVGDFVETKMPLPLPYWLVKLQPMPKPTELLSTRIIRIIHKTYFYKEHLISITKKGMDGAAQIQQMMVDLRENPPKEIDRRKVTFAYDYDTSVCKNLLDGSQSTIDLPKSNVLIFYTENGTRVAARPSGTEPKIKFYFSVNTALDTVENSEAQKKS